MRIYDITVPLGPDTHIWDDGAAPRLLAQYSIPAGDFANVTTLEMGAHSGTHTDAPSHFVADGATIDQLPASTLVGSALVVEHRGPHHITAVDVDALGVDGRCERVLFKTSNGPLWDSPSFRRDFGALAPSAATRYRGETLVRLLQFPELVRFDHSISPPDPQTEAHAAIANALQSVAAVIIGLAGWSAQVSFASK